MFDHVREDLGPGLALSVQQVCWYSSFGCFFITLLLGISLLMHFNGLFHLYLFGMPLFMVQLRLQPDHLLGLTGPLMRLSALLLPPLLVVVQPVAIAFAVELDVLVLRHVGSHAASSAAERAGLLGSGPGWKRSPMPFGSSRRRGGGPHRPRALLCAELGEAEKRGRNGTREKEEALFAAWSVTLWRESGAREGGEVAGEGKSRLPSGGCADRGSARVVPA